MQLHLQPPPHGLQLIEPRRVLLITMSRGLHSSQVGEMLRSRSFHRTLLLDDVMYTWFDNGIEEFSALDEVMGTDDGKDYDFDSNLDT